MFFSFDLIVFTLYFSGFFFFGIYAYETSVWLVRKMNEEKEKEVDSEMDLLDKTHFSSSVV